LITASLIRGNGYLPGNASVGGVVFFSLTDSNPQNVLWNLESAPNGSVARLFNTNGATTKLLDIDKYGVYFVKAKLFVGTPTEKEYSYSVSVPQTVHNVIPPEPVFEASDRVRNFNFELPGEFFGEAHYWNTEDDNGILFGGGGATRGRIEHPIGYDKDTGFIFCLGDDLNEESVFYRDTLFSISQVVDFSNIETLEIALKFRKG